MIIAQQDVVVAPDLSAVKRAGVCARQAGVPLMQQEGGEFVLHAMQTWEREGEGALQTVLEDGRMVRIEGLATLRRLW